MSETIQVRGVPKKVHAELVRRAKEAGLSLNKYLLGEFERMARISRNAELLRRVDMIPGRRPPPGSLARAVREGRDERDREFDERYGPRD